MTAQTEHPTPDTSIDPASESEAIACDLSAIPAGKRAAHFALAGTLLFGDASAVHEIEDGLRFELAPDRLTDVSRFIESERRCCRHLAFTLEVPPRSGKLVLRVTGPGAKEELRTLLRSPGARRTNDLMATMLRFRLPRHSLLLAVAAVVVVATIGWYGMTGAWRGATLGGASVVALLACAVPCSAPFLGARFFARRKR